jgi:hypothetical protein
MYKTMVETQYGCAGSCGGKITEEQFNAGQNICNDQDCDCYGRPLGKMKYCSFCNEYYTRQSADYHGACG